MMGGPEVLVLSTILLIIIWKLKGKKETMPETIIITRPPVNDLSSNNKEVTQNCPKCGAKLTELNFFKLKAGSDTKCDYCDEIISSGD